MLIPVMLKDGSEEVVRPRVLDRMLEDGDVSFFRRSSGWVVVGRDAVRGMGGNVYRGKERRSELRRRTRQ